MAIEKELRFRLNVIRDAASAKVLSQFKTELNNARTAANAFTESMTAMKNVKFTTKGLEKLDGVAKMLNKMAGAVTKLSKISTGNIGRIAQDIQTLSQIKGVNTNTLKKLVDELARLSGIASAQVIKDIAAGLDAIANAVVKMQGNLTILSEFVRILKPLQTVMKGNSDGVVKLAEGFKNLTSYVTENEAKIAQATQIIKTFKENASKAFTGTGIGAFNTALDGTVTRLVKVAGLLGAMAPFMKTASTVAATAQTATPNKAEQGVAAAKPAMSTNANIKNQIIAFEKLNSEIAKLTRDYDTYYAQANKTISGGVADPKLREHVNKLIQSLENASNKGRNLKASLSSVDSEKFTGQITKLTDVFDKKTSKNVSNMKTNLEGVHESLKNLSTGAKNTGSAMSGFAKKFDDVIAAQLRFLVAGFVLFRGLAAIKAAFASTIEFSDRLAKVFAVSRSNVLLLEERYYALGDAIVETSAEMGRSIQNTSEILFQFGSAGLQAEESLAALNSTMQLIIATDADVTFTTKTIAATYRLLGDRIDGARTQTEKFARINDIIAATYRDNQVEINELTQALKFSVPVAKQLGLSFEQLNGILATLQNNMIRSGEAGRSLRAIFSKIAGQSELFGKAFGIAIDPNKPIDFLDVLKKINERMNEGGLTAAQVGQVFTRLGLRGANSFLILTQKFNEVEDAIGRLENTSQGAAEQMSRIRLDSIAGQVNIFKETVLKLARDAFVPVFAAIVGVIKAINWLYDLLKDTVFGTLLGVLTKIAIVYGAWKTAIVAATLAQGALLAVTRLTNTELEKQAVVQGAGALAQGVEAVSAAAAASVKNISFYGYVLNKTLGSINALILGVKNLAVSLAIAAVPWALGVGVILAIGAAIYQVFLNTERLTKKTIEAARVLREEIAERQNQVNAYREVIRKMEDMQSRVNSGIASHEQSKRAISDAAKEYKGLGYAASISGGDIQKFTETIKEEIVQTEKLIKARNAIRKEKVTEAFSGLASSAEKQASSLKSLQKDIEDVNLTLEKVKKQRATEGQGAVIGNLVQELKKLKNSYIVVRDELGRTLDSTEKLRSENSDLSEDFKESYEIISDIAEKFLFLKEGVLEAANAIEYLKKASLGFTDTGFVGDLKELDPESLLGLKGLTNTILFKYDFFSDEKGAENVLKESQRLANKIGDIFSFQDVAKNLSDVFKNENFKGIKGQFELFDPDTVTKNVDEFTGFLNGALAKSFEPFIKNKSLTEYIKLSEEQAIKFYDAVLLRQNAYNGTITDEEEIKKNINKADKITTDIYTQLIEQSSGLIKKEEEREGILSAISFYFKDDLQSQSLAASVEARMLQSLNQRLFSERELQKVIDDKRHVSLNELNNVTETGAVLEEQYKKVNREYKLSQAKLDVLDRTAANLAEQNALQTDIAKKHQIVVDQSSKMAQNDVAISKAQLAIFEAVTNTNDVIRQQNAYGQSRIHQLIAESEQLDDQLAILEMQLEIQRQLQISSQESEFIELARQRILSQQANAAENLARAKAEETISSLEANKQRQLALSNGDELLDIEKTRVIANQKIVELNRIKKMITQRELALGLNQEQLDNIKKKNEADVLYFSRQITEQVTIVLEQDLKRLKLARELQAETYKNLSTIEDIKLALATSGKYTDRNLVNKIKEKKLQYDIASSNQKVLSIQERMAFVTEHATKLGRNSISDYKELVNLTFTELEQLSGYTTEKLKELNQEIEKTHEIEKSLINTTQARLGLLTEMSDVVSGGLIQQFSFSFQDKPFTTMLFALDKIKLGFADVERLGFDKTMEEIALQIQLGNVPLDNMYGLTGRAANALKELGAQQRLLNEEIQKFKAAQFDLSLIEFNRALKAGDLDKANEEVEKLVQNMQAIDPRTGKVDWNLTSARMAVLTDKTKELGDASSEYSKKLSSEFEDVSTLFEKISTIVQDFEELLSNPSFGQGFIDQMLDITKAITSLQGLEFVVEYEGQGFPSIFKVKGEEIPGMATGGKVPGVNKGRDSVFAMLQPGEFVIPKDVVDKIGTGYFSELIDKTEGYKNGGVVGYQEGGNVRPEMFQREEVISAIRYKSDIMNSIDDYDESINILKEIGYGPTGTQKDFDEIEKLWEKVKNNIANLKTVNKYLDNLEMNDDEKKFVDILLSDSGIGVKYLEQINTHKKIVDDMTSDIFYIETEIEKKRNNLAKAQEYNDFEKQYLTDLLNSNQEFDPNSDFIAAGIAKKDNATKSIRNEIATLEEVAKFFYAQLDYNQGVINKIVDNAYTSGKKLRIARTIGITDAKEYFDYAELESLTDTPGFAKGGSVLGYNGGGAIGSTDTVPAMLTPGEYVIPKFAVDALGPSFFEMFRDPQMLNELAKSFRGFKRNDMAYADFVNAKEDIFSNVRGFATGGYVQGFATGGGAKETVRTGGVQSTNISEMQKIVDEAFSNVTISFNPSVDVSEIQRAVEKAFSNVPINFDSNAINFTPAEVEEAFSSNPINFTPAEVEEAFSKPITVGIEFDADEVQKAFEKIDKAAAAKELADSIALITKNLEKVSTLTPEVFNQIKNLAEKKSGVPVERMDQLVESMNGLKINPDVVDGMVELAQKTNNASLGYQILKSEAKDYNGTIKELTALSSSLDLSKQFNDLSKGIKEGNLKEIGASIGGISAGLAKGVEHGTAAFKAFSKEVEDSSGWVKELFKNLKSVLSGPIKNALNQLTSQFKKMSDSISNMIGSFVGTFLVGAADIVAANQDAANSIVDSYYKSRADLVEQLKRNEISYFDYFNRLEDLTHDKDDSLADQQQQIADQFQDMLGQFTRDFAGAVTDTLKGLLSDFNTFFGEIVDSAIDVGSKIFDTFGQIGGAIGSLVQAGLAGLGSAGGAGIAGALGAAAGTAVGPAGTAIGLAIGSIVGSAAGGILDTVMPIFGEMAKALSSIFTTAVSGILDLIPYIVDLATMTKQQWASLFGGLTGEVDAFGNAISVSFGESVFGRLPDEIKTYGEQLVTRLNELFAKLFMIPEGGTRAQIEIILDELSTAIGNAIPAIGAALEKIAPKLPALFLTVFKVIVEQVPSLFISAFKATAETFKAILTNADLKSVFTGLVEGFATVVMSAANDLVRPIADAFIEFGPTLIVEFANIITENVKPIVDAAVVIIDAIADVMRDPNVQNAIIYAFMTIAGAIFEAVIDAIPPDILILVGVLGTIAGAFILIGGIITSSGVLLGLIELAFFLTKLAAVIAFVYKIMEPYINAIILLFNSFADELKASGIIEDVFNELSDAMRELFSSISEVVAAFTGEEIDSNNIKALAKILAFIAVQLVKVIRIFTLFIRVIALIVSGLASWIAMVNQAIEAFGEIFTEFDTDVIINAIDALSVAYESFMSGLITSAQNLFFVGDLLTTKIQQLNMLWGAMSLWLENIASFLDGDFKTIINRFLNQLRIVSEFIANTVTANFIALRDSVSGAVDFVMMLVGIFTSLGETITGVATTISGALTNAFDALLNPINEIISTVTGEGVTGNTSGNGGVAGTGIGNGAIINAVAEFFGIPTFATGGVFTSSSGVGLAYLHDKEGVLNRQAMDIIGTHALNMYNAGIDPYASVTNTAPYYSTSNDTQSSSGDTYIDVTVGFNDCNFTGDETADIVERTVVEKLRNRDGSIYGEVKKTAASNKKPDIGLRK